MGDGISVIDDILDDIPSMDKSKFRSIYESISDNPDAIKELKSIMDESTEGLRAVVEKYETLISKDNTDLEDILRIEAEKNQIEVNQLERIQNLLQKENERKQGHIAKQEAEIRALTQKVHRVGTGRKLYPNDPCPCGSGKKYKKCCGSVR